MAVDEALLRSLTPWRNSAAVVLGIGNVLKGDDGIGPHVCERLTGSASVKVIDGGVAPENHLQPILDTAAEVLIVVDAADFGGRPGEVRLLSGERIREFAFCTHALSLHLLLRILQAERDLHVLFIGVQPECTTLGSCLSPAARRALDSLVETLTRFFAPQTERGNDSE